MADKHWGKGYATEAASACLSWAKEHKLCQRLYAFTTVTNTPSANVMRRIGMSEIGRFQHPALPDGHRLKEHLLFATNFFYKITTPDSSVRAAMEKGYKSEAVS